MAYSSKDIIKKTDKLKGDMMEKLAFWGVLAGILCISQLAFSQQLSPGDGIRLTVYNIPDEVSGDYWVQNDWRIQFPYIGSLYVRNAGFEGIQAVIKKKYRMIYRDLEIVVQPLYRIKVLGEVGSPGIYFVQGVEKLSDVIALAGGETPNANINKTYLIRDDIRIDINAKEILQNGRKLDDFGMRSGDHIYVSRKKVVGLNNASVLLSAAALVITTVALMSR